jgi:PhzF family phenazine biosynthesis protein
VEAAGGLDGRPTPHGPGARRRRVAPCRGRPPLLPKLVEDAGVVCLYLAAVEVPSGQARARSFFLGDVGVLEDPATGSAAGPLIAYLAERAALKELVVHQGEEIGRPSVLHARQHPDGVIVGGDVVVVAEGRTFL